MPQGMGYPKGDMVMKKGKMSMSEMMGIKKGSSSKESSCDMKGKKKMFPFKKGGR